MRRVQLNLLLLLFTCAGFALHAQTIKDIRFVNTGAMNVEGTMYVDCDMQMQDVTGRSVEITHNGVTALTGSFYHDASNNVFTVDSDGYGTSTGTFRFTSDKDLRYVSSSDTANFNRETNYIAFPNISMKTDGKIRLPYKMGIDVLSISREAGNTGVLYLASDTEGTGTDQKVYDASLRITTKANDNSGASSDYVPAGTVVVERDVTPYRPDEDPLSTTKTPVLFAYATPFENQRSAYFAGNWVRRMLTEETTGHVQYVYGNKQDEDGVIFREQHVTNPVEELIPGRGYLVQMRQEGFEYEELKESGGLYLTDNDNDSYRSDKMIFAGNPFGIGQTDKQLFAADILYRSPQISGVQGKTINWIIGNSYTAPISISKLKDEMLGIPGNLIYSSLLYLFPAGATSYQVVRLNGTTSTSMTLIDTDVIPAMSYFMIRLSGTANHDGQLTLTKDILTHGTKSHGLKAATRYNNELVFSVSPDNVPALYDLAGVGLRSNGNPYVDSNDIAKVSNTGEGETFQLYTLAADNTTLSVNILPEETTERVTLCFYPGMSEGTFRLSTRRMESLRTEALWLEDLKTGELTDLQASQGEYVFQTQPGDNPERFIVHFTPRGTTGLGEADTVLKLYYSNNRIYTGGSGIADTGSILSLTDMQGRLIYSQKIMIQNNTFIDVSALPNGTYIVLLDNNGKRKVQKFIK